jgi:hypothetical protein
VLRSAAAGNDSGEPALEERAGHHAVLHGEEAEQASVHEERQSEGDGGSSINGLRHNKITDEARRIAEDREKKRVSDHAVKQHGGAIEKRGFVHDVGIRLKAPV